MTTRVAADDLFARPPRALLTLQCAEQGLDIPDGHVGPVRLSGTGRTVWWTGRVAIGLRYQAPRPAHAAGPSARWIQDVLLRA